ncbi:hypothetical protein [Bacteriovorax sp. Seq25_V]|nr:hypothetical protein [Bacteriovorax sp. Seq25_V]
MFKLKGFHFVMVVVGLFIFKIAIADTFRGKDNNNRKISSQRVLE